MPSVRSVRQRVEGDPRLKRMLRGGLSGVMGKLVGVLVGAVSLPLTVRYLGKLEYGIWVTISTSVVMLAVLDLGIANTLTNFIAKAYAQQDEEMAQRYFATALWITIGISAVLACGSVLVFRAVNWGSLFHLSDPGLVWQAKRSVAICVGFFLLGLPLNLANRVLSGYQEVHLANYFAIFSSVLGLFAIVTAVLLHGSLVTLTTLYCGGILMGALLLNVWLCFWHRPGIWPGLRAVELSVSRELFGEGILFFVLQLAGLIVFNSDNLVITHYLGASEVTPYSVAWRLTGYASTFQAVLLPSAWPAFSEAYHRGDLKWVRETYQRMMRGSLLAVGAAALGIGLIGRPLIRVWAGQAAVPGTLLLWCMCFWVVLLAYTVNQAMLLAATQRIQLQSASSVVAALANLGLSIVLVQRMGALGVLLATIVSYLLFVVAPQVFEVRRVLSGQYMQGDAC